MAPRNKAATQEVAKQDESGGALVEKNPNQIVPSIRVASAEDMADIDGVVGAGVSDNPEDRGVPLLSIAHKAGPQLDKKQADKYIEGLEFGDVFNNITKAFYKTEETPLVVLPCFSRTVWKRWTPRDAGGGFRGTEPRDSPLLKVARPFVNPEKKDAKPRRDIMVLPDGDELHMTVDYYCVIEDTWQQVVIPMASTNLGASRTLQTLLDEIKIQIGEPPNVQIVTQPAFWSRVALRTVYKDEGDYQWYNYSPSILGLNENATLKKFCKAYALSVMRNEVKVSEPADDGAATPAAVTDDTIPV